jgi:membrane-bound lytic murein transglycosylase D
MHPLKRRILPFAAFLFLSVPVATSAADLSLPFHSWSQVSDALAPYDPDDPLVTLLMMEEIDVWGRMREGFAMPNLDHPLVATHTRWYASRPEYFDRTTPRAARYLFHVVQELESRGMPTELALLPFIESAFNPQAYSRAKAAGLWQFIPSTGREYKLTQSLFLDERRSVIASTDAALTYLQKLHGMFDDWHLALAAYNWGEGSVQRAMARARSAGIKPDFKGLAQFMPAETRNYVPKLQALKNVIALPDDYAISLPRVDNQPYFVVIGKMRDIDVQVAAQLAELPLDEFKALNPQFNKPVIPGGAGTAILLPTSNAEAFKTNIAKWSRSLSNWSVHTVTGGRERIETIAKKFGTTPELIREINKIPPRMVLAAGSTVLVPRPENAGEKNIDPTLLESAKMVAVPDIPDGRRVTVKVAPTDTLSAIARRHRVSVTQIMDWNSLSTDKLLVGQVLTLHMPQLASPGNRRTASQAPPRRTATSPAAPRKTAATK